MDNDGTVVMVDGGNITEDLVYFTKYKTMDTP